MLEIKSFKLADALNQCIRKIKDGLTKSKGIGGKMEKEDIYLSTASWGKSEPTYETKQFLLALIIKEKITIVIVMNNFRLLEKL